jgi:hypothetical protein
MKEYAKIFPSPPKLCYECETKQYDFLRFRRENEEKMTREELNSALASKFKCCDRCTENTKRYFEKLDSSSLAPLSTLTVNFFCFRVKKKILLEALTYLIVTLRTLFDSLFVFFQILFCLQASNILDFPDVISVSNFQIPFKLVEQNFYTTVFNMFIGLILLEISSYYFHFSWSNTRSNFSLRSTFYFMLGWTIKIAMGKILFEKQQHEYMISFNPLTYYALILSIIDIYLTRRQLSAKRQIPSVGGRLFRISCILRIELTFVAGAAKRTEHNLLTLDTNLTMKRTMMRRRMMTKMGKDSIWKLKKTMEIPQIIEILHSLK